MIWSNDESFDAIANEARVKVDQQAHSFLCQANVGQYLRLEDWVQFFDALDLNDHEIRDDEVNVVLAQQSSL